MSARGDAEYGHILFPSITSLLSSKRELLNIFLFNPYLIYLVSLCITDDDDILNEIANYDILIMIKIMTCALTG